jgi:hypothetical protein
VQELDKWELEDMIIGAAEAAAMTLPAADPTDPILAAAKRFNERLEKVALKSLRASLPELTKDQADDVLSELDGFGYASAMTLRGEGVGIWDGRYDDLEVELEDESVVTLDSEIVGSLSKAVESDAALQGFFDSTGSGEVAEAIENLVWEQGVSNPNDDDVFINSDESEAYYLNNEIASADTRDELCDQVRNWMQEENYYPNVWVENERGGYTRLDVDSCSLTEDYHPG